MVSRRDWLAVGGLLALTVAAQAPMLVPDPLVAKDAVTQFVPWYAELGQRLRDVADAGLPGWNPHVFSGAPLAADPLSGWGYLPAMGLFTVLPLEAATPVYLTAHLALAGVGAYGLGRALGMPVTGALTAAVAAEFASYVFLRNPCCFAFPAVAAWLPVTLLGFELVAQARTRRGRLRAWVLGGVALSQILTGWPGQGALYAGLVVAGWVVWRTLVSPPQGASPRARVGGLVRHGGVLAALGAALAAALLVPLLIEYYPVSNVATSYPGTPADPVAGWRWTDWGRVITYGPGYAGVATLALAAAAPVVARRRFAVPLLVAVCAGALVLALRTVTPLHEALFLVPGAEGVHPRHPERVMLVFYLPAALLAGATVSLISWRKTVLGVVALAAVTVDLVAGNAVGVVELTNASRVGDRLVRTDLGDYYAPSAGGRYLQQAGSGDGAGRYFGYRPAIDGGQPAPYAYSVRWRQPQIAALEVNNEATLTELGDIQGYNPTHIARYDEFVTALNGIVQDYHFADVRPSGLDSPLLDLLNVRWVLTPRQARAGDPADIATLAEGLPKVAAGGLVRVLERPSALPRAWLVHRARAVEPGRALRALTIGETDPRRTALLEAEPPPLSTPAEPAADRARLTEYGHDRLTVATESGGDAMLVLSEVAYPAWQATVDGEPARVYTANHTLRAVRVPEGEHTVRLSFVSWPLRVGTAISAVATVVGLAMLRPWPHRRRRGDQTRAPESIVSSS